MFAYLVIGLVFLAVAVGALVASFSARRVRTAQRLATIDEYGFNAQPALASLPAEPQGNPLADAVTKVGELVGRWLGGVTDEGIRAELTAAGMYFTSPRTVLGYRVLLALVLPVGAYLLLGTRDILSICVIGLMALVGWLVPVAIVRRRARERLTAIERKLPDLIDLLCVMVEAGLGFRAALRLASEQFRGPLRDELRLTLQEQTMGLDTAEALSNLADRCRTPAMLSFVRAMSQGERMGISTGQIMRNLSHEMRLRRRRSAEERAQKAPVKLLFPLAFLIFPAMFIVIMTPAVIKLLDTFNS